MISFCCEEMLDSIMSGVFRISCDLKSNEYFVAPVNSITPMIFCPYCMKELNVVKGYDYVRNK